MKRVSLIWSLATLALCAGLRGAQADPVTQQLIDDTRRSVRKIEADLARAEREAAEIRARLDAANLAVRDYQRALAEERMRLARLENEFARQATAAAIRPPIAASMPPGVGAVSAKTAAAVAAGLDEGVRQEERRVASIVQGCQTRFAATFHASTVPACVSDRVLGAAQSDRTMTAGRVVEVCNAALAACRESDAATRRAIEERFRPHCQDNAVGAWCNDCRIYVEGMAKRTPSPTALSGGMRDFCGNCLETRLSFDQVASSRYYNAGRAGILGRSYDACLLRNSRVE